MVLSIGKLRLLGHRPMQLLSDSTGQSRKRFAPPMRKARTGAQTCIHSCLTTVRHLMQPQGSRQHFCILDERSEPKYLKLRHRCLMICQLHYSQHKPRTDKQSRAPRLMQTREMEQVPLTSNQGTKYCFNRRGRTSCQLGTTLNRTLWLTVRVQVSFCSEGMDVCSCAMCHMYISCTRTL